MKRIIMLLTLILALMCPALAGAEVSSDKMILDWTTSKVWVNGGDLCVTGTFVKNGEVFGKLYVISSKKSDSDFMEEYISKQRNAGNKHMYVFDKPQWEVWPKSKYSSDKKFHIAKVGDAFYKRQLVL